MEKWEKVFDRVCNNENNRKKYEKLNMTLTNERSEDEKNICKYLEDIKYVTEVLEIEEVDDIRKESLKNLRNRSANKLENILDGAGWEV